MKSLSRVRLFATPWTVAHQAPPSMGFSRQEYWSGLPFPAPGESSRPRDGTLVSRIAGRHFNLWATTEALKMVIIKNGMSVSKDGVNWKTCVLLVGIGSTIAAIENSVEIPQKIKNRTSMWSSNSTSGSISKRTEIRILNKYLHSYVHCSIIHNSQAMETTQVSIDRYMDKENYLGKIKHYLAWKTRKLYVQFVTTWMNLVDIKLNKSVIESQSCVTPFAWGREKLY